MPLPSPFTPRQFVIITTTLLTTLLTLLMILAPIDEWWAVLFPRELAVHHLQTSRGAMPFRGCMSGPAADWQILRAEANAGTLFDSVATFATTATGRVLGLAGLQDASSPRFAVLRDSLLAHSNDSLVLYRDPAPPRWASLREVLTGPLLDSAIADLKSRVSHVEC